MGRIEYIESGNGLLRGESVKITAVEAEAFKYKLVWQEKENDWNTAVGNSYNLEHGILTFDGSKGVIVLSPNVKWIVK